MAPRGPRSLVALSLLAATLCACLAISIGTVAHADGLLASELASTDRIDPRRSILENAAGDVYSDKLWQAWAGANGESAGLADGSSILACERGWVWTGARLPCTFSPRRENVPIHAEAAGFAAELTNEEGQWSVFFSGPDADSFPFNLTATGLHDRGTLRVYRTSTGETVGLALTLDVAEPPDDTSSLDCGGPYLPSAAAVALTCTFAPQAAGRPVAVPLASVVVAAANGTARVAGPAAEVASSVLVAFSPDPALGPASLSLFFESDLALFADFVPADSAFPEYPGSSYTASAPDPYYRVSYRPARTMCLRSAGVRSVCGG